MSRTAQPGYPTKHFQERYLRRECVWGQKMPGGLPGLIWIGLRWEEFAGRWA